MRVGVLALQGDFREHLAVIERLGHEGVAVRTEDEIESIEALIIPGGESTTIGRLATIYGLIDPLQRKIEAGLPVLGTCAGMIFLATATTGPDQPQLGVLDAVVERNAFGRQQDSFEAEIDVEGLDAPLEAVFIRAPWIEKVGGSVDVLATVADPASGRDRPVVVRQGNIVATSFHPELTADDRIHRLFLVGSD